MRRFTAALWAMVLLGQTDGTQPPKMTADDVTAGAKTFRSHCAECHGLNGEGGRGPNLSDGVFYHGSSDPDLLRNISNGIPGTEMPGLFYSSDRVWQVIAYIRSLNQTRRLSLREITREGGHYSPPRAAPTVTGYRGEAG